MKRTYGIAALIAGLMFLISVFVLPGRCFAELEEIMPNDPRFTEARMAVSKGKGFVKKAEREDGWNKGRAHDNFRNAEKEFDRAAEIYSRLGVKYNANVEYELEECEKLARNACRQMGRKRSKTTKY